MVHWILGDPADPRPPAQPDLLSRLANALELVFGVADLTDRRLTLRADHSDFTAPKLEGDVATFLGDHLRARPRRATEFGAAIQPHLDAMHRGPQRHPAQRHSLS